MKAIVTVKPYDYNPKHDPKNKKSGMCPLGITNIGCTDVTGKHHSYIEEGKDLDEIKLFAVNKYGYVTRVEIIQ